MYPETFSRDSNFMLQLIKSDELKWVESWIPLGINPEKHSREINWVSLEFKKHRGFICYKRGKCDVWLILPSNRNVLPDSTHLWWYFNLKIWEIKRTLDQAKY